MITHFIYLPGGVWLVPSTHHNVIDIVFSLSGDCNRQPGRLPRGSLSCSIVFLKNGTALAASKQSVVRKEINI